MSDHDETPTDPEGSQPNPVAHNADADVLPQSGKPSQAEGEDGPADPPTHV